MNLASTSELLTLLADPNRLRLLNLLQHDELSVAELTDVLRLAQSRVSTHLGRLKDAGLVVDRRAGTQAFYKTLSGKTPGHRLFESLRPIVADDVLEADLRRAQQVRSARANGEPAVELTYAPGRTFEAYAHGLLGLLTLGDVLDAGAGDGAVSALIAPHARSVTVFDVEGEAVALARQRLKHATNARFAVGDLHAMPFADHSFDTVLLFNVLTCAEHPREALSEVARVLRLGGQAVIVTLAKHSYAALTRAHAHVHAGFAPATLRRWLQQAGFEVAHCAISAREPREPFFEIVTAVAKIAGMKS